MKKNAEKAEENFDNIQLKNFKAIITEKDIEIKNLKKDIEEKKWWIKDLKKNAEKAKENFDDKQLKNFETIIVEKDIEIKNLKKDIKEKERWIRDLKKNAEKVEENDQFHELFNIIFEDSNLDFKSKIKKLKHKVCLIYFKKVKEEFVKSVFNVKENLGSNLKNFLDHLLEQSEIIKKNIDKNQEFVTFAKGQLSAYKIVLEDKL